MSQPIIIKNGLGCEGEIGSQTVVRRAADGYSGEQIVDGAWGAFRMELSCGFEGPRVEPLIGESSILLD